MFCPTEQFAVLPQSLRLGEKSIPIDTDFRHWLHFWRVLAAERLTAIEKQNIALLNIFRSIPENTEEAMEEAITFFRGGQLTSEHDPTERLLDWERDWHCIWADFKLYAHIDLDHAPLHWWRFLALFESLPKESGIKRRISTRAIDLSSIQDAKLREEYRRMKEAVALDSVEAEDMDSFYTRAAG